ncbi:MAG: hypothetical protein GW938_16795 [Leptospira sp.]|nr:hypothetical protein [Leptospira sp.]
MTLKKKWKFNFPKYGVIIVSFLFLIQWEVGDKVDVQVMSDWYRPGVIKSIDASDEICVEYLDFVDPKEHCNLEESKLFKYQQYSEPVENIFSIPEIGVKQKNDPIDVKLGKMWLKAKISNIIGEGKERTIYYTVDDWDGFESYGELKDIAKYGKFTKNKKNPPQPQGYGPQKISGDPAVCGKFKTRQACQTQLKSSCSWEQKKGICQAL